MKALSDSCATMFGKKRDKLLAKEYQFLIRMKEQNAVVNLGKGDFLDLNPQGTWPVYRPIEEGTIFFRFVCEYAEWSCIIAMNPDGEIQPRDRMNVWTRNIEPYLKEQMNETAKI